jgi:hypothetical protein
MRWQVTIAVLALALVSCGHKRSPQDQAVRDARDVELVKRANRTAIKMIAPQLILYPDIEANQLQGAGCAFAPENGLGAVLLTRSDGRAYMKLADKVVLFSADAGSADLPMGARSRYLGNGLVLEFAINTLDAGATGPKLATYSGRLTVHDAERNMVYDKPGSVQCGN